MCERLIPHEAQVAEDDAIPTFLIREIRQLGLFGMSIPEEYGGLGLSVVEEVAAAFVLGKASPAFRSLIGTNNGIGSQGIIIDGTPEQKTRYLPKLASGEMIASFALPNQGGFRRRIDPHFRAPGWRSVCSQRHQALITNAPHAGLFTVFARTDPSSKNASGVTAFLVEAAVPSICLGAVYEKMGHKGSHTCDVIFEDCRVPASAILGGREGVGFKTAMKVLDRGRLHISAICVGAAERLIRDTLAYAMEREQFGEPIAQKQLVQAMLADSKAEAYAARCMIEETARRKDGGANVSTDVACCKMFASEMVGRIADRAVQIYGGAGYMEDYGIERFYRDVRLFRIYEGTTQIQQIIIARNMISEASA